MLCAKCNHDNPADALFCMKCGTKVENRCSSCNTTNPPDANFCRRCGRALGAGTPDSSPSPTAAAKTPRVEVTHERQTAEGLDGERKTVTALFADIKGSMELMEDLDPEEARAIVDPALKLMIDAVHHYDGYVVQSTGDGIFALFGAPIAREDHAQRALYAALRMQEELRRYSGRQVAEGGNPMQCRVGVNSGEVVVRTIKTGESHTEYTPIGHTTNLASRMQAVAPVGSIAVTEATRKLVEGYFQLKALGPTKVKGVSEPVEVFEVTGLGPLRTRLQRAAGRGLTKFVGREREIDALRHAAELAKTGHGQIVAAMAEPGVGKSRLFYEFRVRNPSGWLVLEAFSVSHGKASAYLPVIDLLHGYFDLKAGDDGRKRREKINGKVITLDPALEDTRPYLFGLLGLVEREDPLMDAQVRRRRTHDAIKRILLRESVNQPLMVIFEDLHWIDDETQALLNLLADSIGTSKVLLLVNYRPEYTHTWGNKTYYSQLRLDPLGEESAEEMLTTLLGGDPSVAPLKRLIAGKTEGNPFFMEEMVQALFEDAALVRAESRAGTPAPLVKLVKPLDSLRIPPTVQGILASRIDRLAADEKELLQTLAVIGMEFQLSVVRGVLHPFDKLRAGSHPATEAAADLSRSHPHPVLLPQQSGRRPQGKAASFIPEQTGEVEEKLNRTLNHLQLAEFIYEQPAAGEVEYTFKHALTHDVAYNSLLIERRRMLHERAGTAIEGLFAGQLADHVSELAHHFTQSANAIKAVRYLTLAGKQSLERAAFAESQALFQSGLDWIKRVSDDAERPKLELELLLASEEILRYVRGIGSQEVADVMRRAEKLCELVGTDAQRFSVLIGMGDVLLSSGDHELAIEKCRLALGLAERTRDPEMLLTATASTGLTLFVAGRPAEALQLARRALEMSRLIQGHRSFLSIRAERVAMAAVGLTLLSLGYPEQAEKAARALLEAARQTTHPSALVASQTTVPVYLALRMPDVARKLAEQGVAAADRSGLVGFVRVLWRAGLGAAIAQQGNPEEGIAIIRSASGEIVATGGSLYTAGMAGLFLIEALTIAGRYDEANTEADALLAQRSFSSSNFAADAHRLKGESILGRDASAIAEAEACFRKAVEIARGQEAKWWELRATVSLARLLARTGRRDEARAMLAEIYGWFTEGFDTADLKDAKALLGELSG